MKFIGNLFWFLLGGLVLSLGWAIVGLIICCTLIGIPFGMQCFKIAGFVIWPFGRNVEIGNFGAVGLIGNIIWILLFGWELCISHLVFGLFLYITIAGIPFGMQHFKLAQLALIPFGAKIYTR